MSLNTMDEPVKPTPKGKSRASKLYSCPHCTYRANRAYNVQRHLVKHFEKPPKELQHICEHAGCSFTTLRWDNLRRHKQRVHDEIKPRIEEPVEVANDELKMISGKTSDDEYPCEEDHSYEDPRDEHITDEQLNDEQLSNDHLNDEQFSDELASMLSEEFPIEFPAEETLETITTRIQTAAPKVNTKDTQKEKRTVKPRKNYKSGKSKYYECNSCSYRTNRTYNIKRHIAKHMVKQGSIGELILHVCVIAGCGFSTPRWDNLCRHVKRMHPEPGSAPLENC